MNNSLARVIERPTAAVVEEAKKEIKGVFRKAKRKPKVQPGRKGYKWTAEQRRNFMKSKKKSAARLRELRAEKRAAKAAGLSVAAYRRTELVELEQAAATERKEARRTERDTEPGSRRSARAETSDAVVYLRAATTAVANVTNAELLALLALRRLTGEIK